jgi:hypothetical protein
VVIAVRGLFLELGEIFGKVMADGVLLPLCHSHRTRGELIGARRPTVSTAAAALARSGELTRRPDGAWLLRDTALAATVAASPASIAQRRRLIALAS